MTMAESPVQSEGYGTPSSGLTKWLLLSIVLGIGVALFFWLAPETAPMVQMVTSGGGP